MKSPRVTLEQWYVLQSVIDNGGYAQAAEKLHKSQSSISYTITRMQEQLGVDLLQIDGRRAKLTDAGSSLLTRARHLVNEAIELENLAHNINKGWETEITVVADTACPSSFLMKSLKEFEPISQGTRVQLREVVLSGAEDALLMKKADLAITAHIPQGFLADEILTMQFIAVAHKDHPLLQNGKKLSTTDLVPHRQVVISDSGGLNPVDAGWLDAEQRWTVSNIDTAVEVVVHGLGYCWLPQHKIQKELDEGSLQILPLNEGQRYSANLHMIFGNKNTAGPATQTLAEIFKQQATTFSD